MRSRLLILLTTAIVTILTACGHETPTSVPEQGVVEYDIMYSGNIRTNNLAGKMLPTKIKGRYNKNGFKFNTQAGLGMIKIGVVATTSDSYMTLNINGEKYITPFAKLFTADDYQKRDTQVEIKNDDTTEMVAGWESKMTSAICQSPIGKIKVDTYYAPNTILNQKLKDSPVPDVPGLITAIKITTAESNIVVMLSDIYADVVSDDEFTRPAMHKETDRENIDSLVFNNLKDNI